MHPTAPDHPSRRPRHGALMSARSAATPRRVADEALRTVVELACLAPSIHNTQPWAWRLRDGLLELHADASRRLPAADPTGRSLVISCGAALHHARVAARALGWEPDVERLPGAEGSPLATLRLEPATPSPTAATDLRCLEERHTDRRRFTSWPVPDERLERLAAAARDQGAAAVALLDVTARFAVELLTSRAHGVQARDPSLRQEVAAWLDRGRREGLVSQLLPVEDDRGSRFPGGALEDSDEDVDGTDGLIVLAGAADDPGAWLRTGEGLSALWLDATRGGLSVVPLSQVVEVDETRAALQHEVLRTGAVPHLLVRVGWQPLSRSEVPHTPRRTVAEVLG